MAISVSLTMICANDDDPYAYGRSGPAAALRRQQRAKAQYQRQVLDQYGNGYSPGHARRHQYQERYY